MASREDWCADKQSKLLNDDLRISTLNEIKQHLITVPQEEASVTAHILELPLVFDCLNNSNTQEIDLACEVLTLCLNNLSLGESTVRYGDALERALAHPHAGVKLMALAEVERSIENDDVLRNVVEKASLLKNVIQCLGDDNLEVVKKATGIIVTVGLSSLGIAQLVSDEILCVFKTLLVISEVVRLRVFEVIIRISKQSESSFNELRPTGLLGEMLKDLDNNDVLVKLNIIEILTQLGLSAHGYDYLERNEVLTKLYNFLDAPDNSTAIQLCEPGILKFFGNMAHQRPLELLSRCPYVFDRLFSNIESRDLSIVGISLDTLGYIGQTNEGKLALDTTGNKISYAIKTIAKLLSSLPTEFRVRALNCIENLMHIDSFKVEISNISRRWFLLLGDNPMDVVVKYAKNPFVELRLAGFEILKALIGHHWGQEEIKQFPGLVEFLLDRSAETKKECKQIKFQIIQLLANSDIFDHLTSERFHKFVKDGAFYMQGVTEVAVEGNE